MDMQRTGSSGILAPVNPRGNAEVCFFEGVEALDFKKKLDCPYWWEASRGKR